VPLNPAALQSEKTNAAMLEYLLKNRGNATITFPRPLIQGAIGPFQYFVESFVVGTPLSGVFKATDPKAMIRSVVSLLGQLNPEPDAADTILLADAEYARQIGQRIEKLKLAINDPNMIDGISGYFSSRLKGVRLPAGVLHGDFSASNILTSRREVNGLIDWEGGSNTGLAILDAITFVDSTYRLLSGKMVSVTIPNLASGHFVDPAYEEFLMQQYDRWHIDSDHHEALVYLKWLRHISYLLDFWLVYDERAIKHFILSVANSLLRRK
jgi:aminoglycoside phosphotransferase (APT) family kinase protein